MSYGDARVRNESLTERIPVGRVRTYARSAATYAGLVDEDLELFVDGLVEADLQGRATHGVIRIPAYVRGFRLGNVNARPDIRVVRGHGASALLEGDNGIGVVVGQHAMSRAIDLARVHGVGIVGVRNSGHTGMLGYHVARAAHDGMVGYFANNGPAVMAPWGAREVMISNNPFAWGFPTGEGYPLILDMACSAAARGKIRLAAKNDEAIPAGWAVDAQGLPTTDPHAAMLGSVLPAAGHKGYGLAVVDEVLAGVLTGAVLSPVMPRAYLEEDVPALDHWGAGHFVMAFDIAGFLEEDEMISRMSELIQQLKSAALAPGFSEVLIPGELEWRTREEGLRSGIPFSTAAVDMLEAPAREFGIEGLRGE
jgi:LDH2 family malate/lactate/ureidoglycolate dehydrogenase